MLDLGIVILNWNTSALLKRCLETVLASEGAFNYRVIVVDNVSTDDSVAMMRQHFPQVELIVSEVNGGYPYGNNLGLRALGFHGPGQVDADAPRYAAPAQPGYRSAAGCLLQDDAVHGVRARRSASPGRSWC